MKRCLSLLLTLCILLSLSACEGNFTDVNLNEPIEIPEDGIIEKTILQQIKDENAIGVFVGTSNGLQYEWTIFGSDIGTPKEINFAVELSQSADGELQIVLRQAEPFGFSALLSVYLKEQWNAQSATAYARGEAVASASVTGSKESILNLSLDGSEAELLIRPDAQEEEQLPSSVAQAPSEEHSEAVQQEDSYLSDVQGGDEQVYTGGKDPYLTDPVPEGKPQPVEPENRDVDTETANTCTFFIECSTIFNNLELLEPDKLEMLPSGGVILEKTTVTFCEGESVFDVLQRVCQDYGIHLESSWTPIYNSAYVEGIHNLYEFDCGNLSGWMYCVNGWYPNYGCSRYQLKDGDSVQWRFTCDLGKDIGGGYAVGG